MALKREKKPWKQQKYNSKETFRGPTQYPFEALQSSIVGCTEGHRKNVSGPFIVASKAKFAPSGLQNLQTPKQSHVYQK